MCFYESIEVSIKHLISLIYNVIHIVIFKLYFVCIIKNILDIILQIYHTIVQSYYDIILFYTTYGCVGQINKQYRRWALKQPISKLKTNKN